MISPSPLDEIVTKISEMISASPAKDVENNLRALLTSALSRLDLVTREEFDAQQAVLARTRQMLAALARRVEELENSAGRSERSL